ncbi:MAG: hypothetical protein IPJ27_07680 [Candidatus Accumulibacter sp.]|uniref:Uncharacterized protein n=1 Tax=Candidatus Accumulibacter proximus TaxID=2954385 RepID=A0A935PWI2_9PROT|nr:hypothetical protein [Candidatus Accumulibacter proximus]
MRVTLKAITRFDAEIETVATTPLPDYALFRALAAAAPNLAPRLLVAFGEQRERYRCWQTRTPYDESIYLKALLPDGSVRVCYPVNERRRAFSG